MILCDTNILIEFYKGNSIIIAELHKIGLPDLAVSIITTGELLYGARNKVELLKMQKHLALLKQISLDEEISNRFLGLLEEFALSHKLSLPDALIAATALSQDLPIYTLNIKDFKFIPDIKFHK
ncbi:MAG TPA: type II toxin-antitoxin system VapC family toxin [Anaerolineales bacterium]